MAIELIIIGVALGISFLIIYGLVWQFLHSSALTIGWILSILFILYIVSAIALYIYRKKHPKIKVVEKEVVKELGSEEIAKIKLIDYIKYSLYYGVKREAIKEKLLKKGWPEKAVEEAFASVEKPKRAPSVKAAKIPTPFGRAIPVGARRNILSKVLEKWKRKI